VNDAEKIEWLDAINHVLALYAESYHALGFALPVVVSFMPVALLAYPQLPLDVRPINRILNEGLL